MIGIIREGFVDVMPLLIVAVASLVALAHYEFWVAKRQRERLEESSR